MALVVAVLVLAGCGQEKAGESKKPQAPVVFAPAVAAAPQWDVLVAGQGVGAVAEAAAKIAGVAKVLVATGMTLVIATRGIDISVGAVVAIAGAAAATILATQPVPTGSLIAQALLAALIVGVLSGMWNGLLVSFVGMQPIIATLILMVAGRGIAQLLTAGQIIPIGAPGYLFVGGGYWLGVPCSVWIATIAVLATAALVEGTALGLFIRAIGVNPVATRLVGMALTVEPGIYIAPDNLNVAKKWRGIVGVLFHR